MLAVLASFAAGCGPSGEGAETDPEKGADAERLNAALAQELGLLHAYTRAVPGLSGESQAVARRFRGHQ
ncbi:MAG TPA: hypothetical protein VEQ41_03880, partial [Solirubrobacterales bacterium]|nr:hypothetical protein [Solirubrobacterales bacterium]